MTFRGAGNVPALEPSHLAVTCSQE